jgi:hypothetical protein
MDSIIANANNIWHIFLTLPIITQWAVTLLFVSAVIVHFFAYSQRSIHDGPSIFTTCGIFFTFLGIAQGLYGFDPQKIDTSIPTLLDGLKTAFIASVVGVGAALSIKLRYALFGLRKQGQVPKAEGATVDDLFNQMVAVQQSLIGQEDSTLLTQMKLARQDTNDRLDKMQQSQSEFMEKMADNNSKALIQALQEVIRDFNTKLSEQFGENFKQLNQAVGQLLSWQEQYRLQLTELIQQQTQTTENMKTATNRYTEVVSSAEIFSIISTKLSALLTGLETQRNQLQESLTSLASLLATASGSLPEVEAKIMRLTEQMTSGVKQNQEEMVKSARESATVVQGVIADLRKALNETTEQLTSNVKQNQAEMTKTVRDSAVTLQGAVADIKTLLLETTQSTNRQINEHMKELAEKTTDQLVKLDVALETELSKSISSLGRHLTSLSGKFVEDYAPLTEKLRLLVQTSKGA